MVSELIKSIRKHVIETGSNPEYLAMSRHNFYSLQFELSDIMTDRKFMGLDIRLED